jgi:hypothetical protein
MGESYEPRRLFGLEIHRGLGVQVQNFPENRHPAHEERTPAQIGGMDFPLVWLLAMDKDERIKLLQKFFRQLLRTATESLDSVDMLTLGIPEEQEVARLLETFNEAVETSKEIGRYVGDFVPTVAEAPCDKGDAPQAALTATNWRPQDDSFGMK